VQVGAPIPVRNKNRGNISAAHAEYHRAAENVRRIELAIQSRLARAAQEFESANASVRTYEQEIMPQVEESLKLSEQAYQAGEIAFLQALVVRRNYYESRIRFIQAQGRLAQANAKIEGLLLTGGLDAPIDYTNGDGLRGQSFGGQ
jgi:cobalt-zinc-cadmium efflux system outer membrane protein